MRCDLTGIPQLPDDILEAMGASGNGVLTKEQERRASAIIRLATIRIKQRIYEESCDQ